MRTTIRRKIWELREYHCPILGTCLSMAELRSLAHKTKLRLPQGATDYDLHAAFVKLCASRNPAAKLVNKLLDRKYGPELRRFGKAADAEALETLWKESAARGDIPGPFWALMSHPATPPKLAQTVFGEVHMLSHLVGAANRADIRRLERQERCLEAHRRSLAAARRARQSLKAKVLELRCELEETREALRAQRDISRHAPPNAATGKAAFPELVRDLADLRRQSAANERAAREHRAEILRQAATIEELYLENKALRETLDRTKVMTQAAIQAVCHTESAESPCQGPEECGRDASSCPCPRLSGKRVLYVGGRCGLLPHYRAVVEGRGACFLHHDGGKEDAPAMLEGALARADVVICPLDCVSHDASRRLKKLCKRANKPFVTLRSSGVSALERSLADVAGRMGSAPDAPPQ